MLWDFCQAHIVDFKPVAGMPLERVAGSDTSVYVASMADDYMRMVTKDPDEAPTNTATGTSPSILANRLSWYFDFKGPSLQLNTACSSSMIAMDLACQSLRSGQCSMVSSIHRHLDGLQDDKKLI